ncbi:hypothetical protein BCR39DRAFT_578162, partial [Naematelia encephala]
RRESLPEAIRWPPQSMEAFMQPGIVTTHGMYNTYIIILFRPYIIDFGEVRDVLPEALEMCMQAAREIVEQCRYIRDFHGVHTAPLSWQHILYVCATTLVMQSSGHPNVTLEEKREAIANLAYLQRALYEFSEVWPAAARTADSLRQLQQESAPP